MFERIYVEAKLRELHREVEAGRVARTGWQARAEARRAGLKGEGIFSRFFSRRHAAATTGDVTSSQEQLPQAA
jgi:hypothetical protein